MNQKRKWGTYRGAMAIPNLAHFIWYGTRFPWVYLLALRSALMRGGFARAVLHHDGSLTDRALRSIPAGVELRPIAGESHFESLGARGARLRALHDRLSSPAAKANVLRMCVLWQEGGVYLDVDTITIRSLAPLLIADAFCGREHIVLPAEIFKTASPLRWAGALGLSTLRLALREVPRGYAYFPRFSALYPTAVNNAVIGARPRHPLVDRALDAMLALPESQQTRRYALGTHLLQQQVACYSGNDFTVHRPEVFYPLPPEVCLHWFRVGRSGDLSRAIHPETRVVHWYASNRNRRLTDQLDPAYVRAHRGRQMFSALAAEFLDASNHA